MQGSGNVQDTLWTTKFSAKGGGVVYIEFILFIFMLSQRSYDWRGFCEALAQIVVIVTWLTWHLIGQSEYRIGTAWRPEILEKAAWTLLKN